MTSTLTIAEMQANVVRSRGHVSRQKAIITRLATKGHEDMAADAKAILVTMHAHLALEIEMLARMEAELKQA